ncbi:MAG TPA: HlyC/CorC family transporter [Gammaproteobacteria bacterium]|nr:HlyC/CorC family transporter [Gammaproteobacteria bacterium]
MSDDVPLGVLFGILALLLLLSAFFSGSETALMSLNRYRLRHRARSGVRGARLAEALLARPDRLIGLILIGNNAVNLAAASITTVIALRMGGEPAIAIGTGALLFVILIFSEVAPKTLAAIRPSRVALPAAYVYYPLLKLMYPLVWLVNIIANGVLRLLGVSAADASTHSLSSEELRTVVAEAGAMIPQRHQRMLISILDLENVSVDDIMVPHNEIVGIELEDDWDAILRQLRGSEHTRLPLFRDGVDHIVGVIHLRTLLEPLAGRELSRELLVEKAEDPYFVPEGTPLNRQLINFQRARQRIAFVVDEYGDIQGLVTLEDILEEIVGEFTTDPATVHKDVRRESDSTWLVDGSANVRALNRMLNWNLPTDGPKTLNGVIVEYLETIPATGLGLELGGYPIEIVETTENAVKTVRIHAPEAEKKRA